MKDSRVFILVQTNKQMLSSANDTLGVFDNITGIATLYKLAMETAEEEFNEGLHPNYETVEGLQNDVVKGVYSHNNTNGVLETNYFLAEYNLNELS